MRIIIAGSSGYLGTALRASWTSSHEVIRLVRHQPQSDDERFWDPYSNTLDRTHFEGVDAVVNLCGVPVAGKRWNAAYKKLIQSSRVQPTQVLATAVADAGVPVLVNASAVGWYSGKTGTVVDETTPHSNNFLGRTGSQWEAACTPAIDAQARVVSVRTGHVIGPGCEFLRKLTPIFRLYMGGRFGDGRQFLPWISLRDWVGAVNFLLDSTVSGPVNLVGPVAATNAHFTSALGQALNRPAPWVIPGWAARIVAGEVSTELLQGAKITPAVLQRNNFEYQDRTIESALKTAL